jgi:hypothetical protein
VPPVAATRATAGDWHALLIAAQHALPAALLAALHGQQQVIGMRY